MKTNYESCARQFKSWTDLAKIAFNNCNTFHWKIVLKFKEESSEVHSKDLYGAEIWHFGKLICHMLKVLKCNTEEE